MSEYRDDKFQMLHEGYREPYHYYFSLEPFSLHKELYWGLEYYSYMSDILANLKKLPFQTLLDVGCGDGFLINTLSRQIDTFETMMGIDLSERAIAHAMAFRTSEKAIFNTLDIRDVNGTFDVILLVEVLEHIQDSLVREFTTAVINRVSPGGYLIVSVPTVNIDLIESHHRHYDLRTLQEHLGSSVSLIDHRFIFNRNSFMLQLIRRLMINRYFVLRNRKILDYLVGKASRHFSGTSSNGAHLVCIFQR